MVDLLEFHAAWPGAYGGAGGTELVFIEAAEAFYPLYELRSEGAVQAGVAVIAAKCLNSVNNCRLRCLHEFPQ